MLRDAPLLAEIASMQDLTDLARSAQGPGPFPFDDAHEYDCLFDGIARILHRSQAHHVLLVGERGVGKHSIVAELARRAVNGQPAFLADKRIITVDCRYVCPEDSRRMIFGILNQVGARPDLIVAIDGFASLLTSERGASNKPLLFAGLSRVSCRLVGLMTPHEYAELIADDPDYADFFGKVDVDEPGPETAVKLLRHYSRGLEQKFQVGIDEAAIQEAVSLSGKKRGRSSELWYFRIAESPGR